MIIYCYSIVLIQILYYASNNNRKQHDIHGEREVYNYIPIYNYGPSQIIRGVPASNKKNKTTKKTKPPYDDMMIY